MSTSGGPATLFATNIGVGNLRGLAFGNGNLYVSDSTNSHNTGAIYLFAGASNTPTLFASNLQGPNYIAINSLGQLLVAEYFGNDVVELAPNGTNLGSFITGLAGPSGIALDPTSSTPEPASFVLFALGSLVLMVRYAANRSAIRNSRPGADNGATLSESV
jgi:hypothetical protein